MQSNSSKEIIYNILRREVHNALTGVPMIGMFEGVICNYLITAIDPYVSAFIEPPDQKVNIDQLSSYMEYEVKNKIAKFKESYQKETSDGQH